MIQEGCSQEDYNFFKREWLRYVRFYEKVDANEIRDQLMNYLDTTVQIVVYRALGCDFDITTQAALLWVIELLVVEKVKKDVHENFDGETDTHYPTMVVVDEEHTVEVVDEDMKQQVVPKVDILHLSYGGCGGQEGGAKDKIVPKTFASCEECQFNMEMEDEISAMRVLQNHKFVAHKK